MADKKDEGKPSVKTLFERVERRHDTLFDDGTGNQKEHLNLTTTEGAREESLKSNVSNLEKIDRLESIQNKGGRSAASAKKTKDLLLKIKATGDKNIASEDRIFVVLNFANDAEARKCIYVNKTTCTVGDLIEKVAKQFPFPAFKKAMRPDGFSLNIRLLSTPSSTALGITPFGLDRNSLVAAVMSDMEELECEAAPSSSLAEISNKIAVYMEDSKRKKKEEETCIQSKPGAEDGKVEPHSINSGDTFRYVKEGVNEIVTVTAVHRDDYPNLYFTIRFISNNYEKQTTAQFLEAITVKKARGDSGGFSVTITHGIQNYTVGGLSEDMTVAEFKVLVQSATSVSPQSLICRGAKLGDDAALLSSTKIKKGCKVMLMGKKK